MTLSFWRNSTLHMAGNVKMMSVTIEDETIRVMICIQVKPAEVLTVCCEIVDRQHQRYTQQDT